MVERRKLIKFGTSSHVLSIPNYWLRKHKLKKGDLLYFEENKNGELVLFPEIQREEILKKINIRANNKSIERLSREIFAAYIFNYHLIVISGDHLNKIMKDVRKILHSFVALEIIEEDDKKIVAKDFLNLRDVSVPENVRRMDTIIRGMFEDMIKSVYGEVDSTIYERDFDVNRFCFLILRAVHGAMENPSTARILNIQNKDLLAIWFLSINLEDIGDEIKRISRFLGEHKLDEDMKKSIKSVFLEVHKSYLEVMKAYYTNDPERAIHVDLVKDGLIADCNKLFEKNPSIGIGRILERLKKLISGIGSIAWVVFGAKLTEKDNLISKPG
ncbi:MAG: phosphate uptake regulator PhoU [Nanoarchaeota archaeon]